MYVVCLYVRVDSAFVFTVCSRRFRSRVVSFRSPKITYLDKKTTKRAKT